MLAITHTTATLTRSATNAVRLNFAKRPSDGRRELNVHISLSM